MGDVASKAIKGSVIPGIKEMIIMLHDNSHL